MKFRAKLADGRAIGNYLAKAGYKPTLKKCIACKRRLGVYRKERDYICIRCGSNQQ